MAFSPFKFFDERFVRSRLVSLPIAGLRIDPLLASRPWTGRRDFLARVVVGGASSANAPLLLLGRMLLALDGSLPTGDCEIGEFSPLLECLGERSCL